MENDQERIGGMQAHAKQFALRYTPHWLHRVHERARIRMARYRGEYTLKDWSRLRRLAARERQGEDPN